jgi:hypothetical protein
MDDDTREHWLVQAVEILRAEVFAPAGHVIPTLRVSCGWPAKKPGIELTAHMGQCWHPDAAADHQPQVFISPIMDVAVPVLDTLAHELVHASGQWNHRKGFRTVAVSIGLQGPMRSTVAGPALQARLAAIADRLGLYPHSALTPATPRRGSRLRLYHCQCDPPVKVRCAHADLQARCLICQGLFEPAESRESTPS